MRISSFLVNILLVNICLLFASDCFAEEITITTYYPSPYGSYNSLQADKLGVGDNDNSGTLTSADVPSTSGYMWVKERVGIGTVTPAYNLDVNGTMRATSISLGGVAKTEWPLATVTGYYVDTAYDGDGAKTTNLGVHAFCFLTGEVFHVRDNTDHDRNDQGQCYIYRSPDASGGTWYLETYCDGDGETSAFQRCYARCVDI